MTIQISSLKRLVFNLYLCVFVCSHACGCMQKPLEGVGSSGARVTGSHEPPSVGAGNFHCVLCQGSKHC